MCINPLPKIIVLVLFYRLSDCPELACVLSHKPRATHSHRLLSKISSITDYFTPSSTSFTYPHNICSVHASPVFLFRPLPYCSKAISFLSYVLISSSSPVAPATLPSFSAVTPVCPRTHCNHELFLDRVPNTIRISSSVRPFYDTDRRLCTSAAPASNPKTAVFTKLERCSCRCKHVRLV